MSSPSTNTTDFGLSVDTQDALNFIRDVKDAFTLESSSPDIASCKFTLFYNLLVDYRQNRIDLGTLLARVSPMLRPHPNLIPQFNTFLPQGWVLISPAPLSGFCESSILHRREQSRAKAEKAQKNSKSLKFIQDVQKRFKRKDGTDGHTYSKFLELLHKPRPRPQDVLSLRNKVYKLFRQHEDLRHGFDDFIDPFLRSPSLLSPMEVLSPFDDTPSDGEPEPDQMVCTPANSRCRTPTRAPSPAASCGSTTSGEPTISVRSSPSTMSDSDTEASSVGSDVPCSPTTKHARYISPPAPLPFYPTLNNLPLSPPTSPGAHAFAHADPPIRSGEMKDTLMDRHLNQACRTLSPTTSSSSYNPFAGTAGPMFPSYNVALATPRQVLWPVPHPPAQGYDSVLYPFDIAKGRSINFERHQQPPAPSYARTVRTTKPANKTPAERVLSSSNRRSARGVGSDEVIAPSGTRGVGAVGDGRPRKDIRWPANQPIAPNGPSYGPAHAAAAWSYP
ncbi:hypothetical protein FRB99_008837 [Tulasnella sp. 403]|nr:hypothetical protein FRB99_008837 [Tulasnella sp. 403]